MPEGFNIVHMLPPGIHAMMGYREVAETLHWGMQQLGHDSVLSVNQFDPQRWNIVLGGQTLQPGDLEQIPKTSVFYQLEQIANTSMEDLKPTVRAIAAG